MDQIIKDEWKYRLKLENPTISQRQHDEEVRVRPEQGQNRKCSLSTSGLQLSHSKMTFDPHLAKAGAKMEVMGFRRMGSRT